MGGGGGSTPRLFFCSLCFGVCSLSGSQNEMRLVGSVKRIVVVLHVLEKLSALSLSKKKISWLTLADLIKKVKKYCY
jgi:hypothetical protein